MGAFVEQAFPFRFAPFSSMNTLASNMLAAHSSFISRADLAGEHFRSSPSPSDRLPGTTTSTFEANGFRRLLAQMHLLASAAADCAQCLVSRGLATQSPALCCVCASRSHPSRRLEADRSEGLDGRKKGSHGQVGPCHNFRRLSARWRHPKRGRRRSGGAARSQSQLASLLFA